MELCEDVLLLRVTFAGHAPTKSLPTVQAAREAQAEEEEEEKEEERRENVKRGSNKRAREDALGDSVDGEPPAQRRAMGHWDSTHAAAGGLPATPGTVSPLIAILEGGVKDGNVVRNPAGNIYTGFAFYDQLEAVIIY